MSNSNGPTTQILLADAPTVDDVPESDLDGNVPAKVLINGGTARVQLWPNYADQTGKADELIAYWIQGGTSTKIYEDVKEGPITDVEFEIPLNVSIFSQDGIAHLYYSVRPVKPFPGNKLDSYEKKLTIDRSVIPLPILPPATFPGATIYGYLNCATVRPIWNGIFVLIPFQNLKKDDVCESVWKGFSVLSGAEDYYVAGTLGEFSYVLSEEDATNINGFELPSIPFIPHSEPLVNKCSGTLVYKIKRAGVYIGQSGIGLVKIDRTIVGSEEPCGPP